MKSYIDLFLSTFIGSVHATGLSYSSRRAGRKTVVEILRRLGVWDNASVSV